MILSIDTDKRDELGISTDAYLLLYAMWMMRSTDKDAIEKALVWERGKIGKVMKECEAAGLLDSVSGELSAEWASLFNPLEKVELSGLQGLSDAIVAYINERTGREFRGGRAFTKAISRLIKAVPQEKGELSQFKRVIGWAVETWPPEFQQYVRPQLFECTPEKYLERCEKANEYYRTKIAKQQ